MNPEMSLAFGAIFGIVGGTVALAALGWWGFPLVFVAMLAGIFVGDRL